MTRWLLAFAVLMPGIAWPGIAAATSLQPLGAADVPALRQPPARGERLIALWALDCAYCEVNLQRLARLQQAHPREIELVIVATDSIELAPQIAGRLRAAGVTGYDSRAYADATPERINYLLDPDWGGEVPRVLVIAADGSRRGYSGALTAAMLKKLLP
jgi:hypothetical protein